jgi:SsrA-binding protein
MAAAQKIFLKNKPATFEFAIEDRLTAGMVLMGSEIKSIRAGKVSFADSYCQFDGNELWVRSLHISPYENSGYVGHDPLRQRKLLLNKKELKKWAAKVKEKGLTIVPLNIFIDDGGYAKMEIGLGRGKKLHDKRDSVKDRDTARELQRYRI